MAKYSTNTQLIALAMSRSEATKKGFRDAKLAKADMDRDYRFSDVKKLNNELEGEVNVLKEDLKKNAEAYAEASKIREEDKKANMDSLAKASQGLEFVKEAILILQSFHKQAGRHRHPAGHPVGLRANDQEHQGHGEEAV